MLRRSYSFKTRHLISTPPPLTRECHLDVQSPQRIARLTLHRPQRRNAIGNALLSELHAVLAYCTDCAAPPRCLIVDSDVADVFCSGADLKERHAMITATHGLTDAAASEEYVTSLRDALNRLEALPFPTIAAVDGVALGGGLELALATDIRIAGSDARFGFPETSLGIMPGAGGTIRATALLGKSTTLELIYTNRQLSAPEARECGLVNRVVPAGTASAAAMAMALRIVANSPFALKVAKEAVCAAATTTAGTSTPTEAPLSRQNTEAALYRRLLTSPDRAEGVAAFVEKRSPRFQT